MPSFFDKLLNKKAVSKKQVEQIQTSPLSEEQVSPPVITGPTIHPSQYIIGSGQSIGLQRDHNEDALLALTSTLADGQGGTPFGLCIIADGMGGHRNGEIASGLCVRAVVKHILEKVYSLFLEFQSEPMKDSIQEILEQAVNNAQKAVVHYAPGGGTTLTTALILGDQVSLAHVGDSRAYFFYPDGRLQKLTKDHSLVQRMVDLEEITEDEAYVHPQKNVLLKAIGQLEPFRADILTYQVPHGGKLMLCSDGLWGVVPELEIFEYLSKSNDPVTTCQELVEAANNAGGPDNISAIIVNFSGI